MPQLHRRQTFAAHKDQIAAFKIGESVPQGPPDFGDLKVPLPHVPRVAAPPVRFRMIRVCNPPRSKRCQNFMRMLFVCRGHPIALCTRLQKKIFTNRKPGKSRLHPDAPLGNCGRSGGRMAGIELCGLSKRWGSFVGVDNINLTIADREFLVLLGPSGCGKTTTMRMIAGLEDATDGEIPIGGRRVNDLQPKDRDIAMVCQS